MADYLQALYDRLYRNPLGTYSFDETSDSPLATSAPVTAMKRNVANFNAAQPYPPPQPPPAQPPPPLPIQTPTALSPDETNAVSRPSTPVNTNPVGTYSPEETGESPIVGKLKANLKKFSEAKPGQGGPSPAFTPPILWPNKPVGMLPNRPAPTSPTQLGPEGVAGTTTPVTADTEGPREVDGSGGGITEGERLGVHDPRVAPGQPPVQTAAGGPHPPAISPDKVMQAGGDDQSALGQAAPRAGLLDWLGQHSNALLALGAGLMGAPNLAQGMSRGFAYMAPAAQADIKMQQLQSGQQGAYNALISAGVPRNLAAAGASNPKVMDKLMDTYITGNKYTIHDVTKTDSWGQKTSTPIAVNERDPSDAYYIETGEPVHPSVAAGKGPQTGTLIQGSNGQPIVVPQPGGGGGGGPPSQQQQSQFYAPGVDDSTFDHTKVGDDYLKQFSPEAQAEIKNRTMGAAAGGFGRGKPEVLQRLQMAADKYGQDMGLPMDPVSLSQRRIWANSLADTKSGVGLQAKGFKQGLEHLANITDKWVKLNQFGGGGIEPVARALNFTISSRRQAIVNGIHSDAQKFGGEVGKLFSQGGTGHERAESEKSVGDTSMSRTAAAGALEAALDQMYGGLRPLEGRRDELFPPGTAPRGSDFVGKAEDANIARIRRNIAILRGEQPANQAAPTSGTSGGLKWSVVPQ